MKKIQNYKILIILPLLVALLLFSSCIYAPLENFYINKVEVIELSIGDKYYFNDKDYVSSDEQIFSLKENVGSAISTGNAYITKNGSNINLYKIIVNTNPKYISVSGDNWIKTNTITSLEVIVSPIETSQEVIFESSDESIIEVNQKGEVRSKNKEGFATIKVSSKLNKNIYTEYSILVEDKDLDYYEPLVNNIIVEGDKVILDSSDTNSLLSVFINNIKNMVVGVEKYGMEFGREKLEDFGSGVIYRRDAIIQDGTIVENVKDTSEIKNIKEFRYYVITTRFLTKDSSKVKIYLGDEYDSVEAKVIQYDDKIDLAVVTFDSKMYFSTIEFGNSDLITQGEFIISIGNSFGKDYFRTANVGVISKEKRFISTDTDADNISDWDSEYIQHDAAINDGDNGGIVINLKGELIGINDTKISSTTTAYNCMSLSIPSNLVKNIVSLLERGEKPERPILGVSIIDVRNFYKNKTYYLTQYPGLSIIPDNMEYGFYVNEVNAGGVGELAGVLVGDIILEFNGVNTKYSYMLRSELGKFIYGSGQTASLKVLRNGVEVTLLVTF